VSGERVVQALVAAINRSDPSGYAARYAVDAVAHDPCSPVPLSGRTAVEGATAALLRAVPDLQWRVRGLVDGGTWIAFQLRMSGVNDGPIELPDADLPPTGRSLAIEAGVFLQLGPDGLIAEAWRYYDATGVACQLGLASRASPGRDLPPADIEAAGASRSGHREPVTDAGARVRPRPGPRW
jgi:predicted ester cyclase